MSKDVELIMPKMGESIAEATILKWLKNEGDTIEIDETVLEIATDKVDSEVPSSIAGILSKRLFKEGDVVPVGKAVALISTDGAAVVEPVVANGQGQEPKSAPVTEVSTSSVSTAIAEPVLQKSSGESGRFYSPLVL